MEDIAECNVCEVRSDCPAGVGFLSAGCYVNCGQLPCDSCKRTPLTDPDCMKCGADNGYRLYKKAI